MRSKWSSKIGVLAVLVMAGVVAAGCGPVYETPDSGKIGVVRGNPDGSTESSTEDKQVKHILCPDSKQKDVGEDVQTRYYHEKRSQRYYLVDRKGRGDRSFMDDFMAGTTADGIQVKIRGKFSFHTNFDCSKEGEKLVRDFDYQYGSRTFPVPGGGGSDRDKSAAPWQAAGGWDAFLDINVRPEIDNTVMEIVGSYTCADLSPACAVLENAKSGTAIVDASMGQKATERRQEIQKKIVAQINEQLEESMGAEYLTFTDFRMIPVILPPGVQKSIDTSQAKFADLTGKQAEVAAAKLEAEKQQALAKNYSDSPAALQLELQRLKNEGLANLPSGTTVYIDITPRG